VPLDAAAGGADVVLVVGRDFSSVTAPAAPRPSTATAGTRPVSPGTARPAAPAAAPAPVGC
jgi:hypothetical protein